MSTIAVIVNTCEKFYKTTLPFLIESAKLTGIPSKNIYIVVGECKEQSSIIREDDYNIVFCKYVNIDYNAAIYFTQNQEGIKEIQQYSHFFYLLDTCEFLPCFWASIQTYKSICDSYIKLEESYSKNTGLFHTQWFLTNKTALMKDYINYDMTLCLEYKDGDFPNKKEIYERFKGLAEFLNEDCLFLFGDRFEPMGVWFQNLNKNQYIVKKYSDEDRLATVYENPGVIKYQKNWGQGGGWNLKL